MALSPAPGAARASPRTRSPLGKASPARDCRELVHLNVGGTLFTTTKGTLTSDPHSVLANIYGDRGDKILLDEQQRFFIDRDPEHFRVILNFQRTHELVLTGGVSLGALEVEAEYFHLQQLLAAIKKHKADAKNASELSRAELVHQLLSSPSTREHPLRLHGLCLRGVDLSKLDLSYCSLTNCDLRNANLSDAKLSNAKIVKCDMRNSNLKGINLQEAELQAVNLTSVDCSKGTLTSAVLMGCDLTNTQVSGASVENSTWRQCIVDPTQKEVMAGMGCVISESFIPRSHRR